MNFKRHLQPLAHTEFGSAALLLLRLTTGIAFILHGWGKIQTPFGWMPEGALPIPGMFQFLAAVSEFGGGIALIIGLLTPLASLGLAITMLVAAGVHAFVFNDPFVATGGGGSFEPSLGYLMVSILLIAMGPGKYSLDRAIFGQR